MYKQKYIEQIKILYRNKIDVINFQKNTFYYIGRKQFSTLLIKHCLT